MTQAHAIARCARGRPARAHSHLPPEANTLKTPPQAPPPARRRPQDAIDTTAHSSSRKTPSNNAGTMASVHTRLIQYLTKMGGGPAPWAPANLAGTAALFGASAVCAGAYTLWGSSGVPGTHKSSLWQEATNAYLKFQGADPISYPEVGKPKF